MPRRSAEMREAGPTERAVAETPQAFAAAVGRLLAHERFRPALARYCRDMAAGPTVDWPVVKMFDQLGRYVVCYMLIHNYYAWRDAAGPAPTLSALQKVVGSSPRQTAGLIAVLKQGRFIEIESDPADRRIKRLKPSPAIIAEIGRSPLLFARALDEIEGLEGRAARLAEPDQLGSLIRRSAAYVLANGTILHAFPGVLHFARRDCGYPLLTALMAAHYARELGLGADHEVFSRRVLAQRFRVSLAHIGNLFAEAEEMGWLVPDSDGRLRPSVAFRTEFERWAAWEMAHTDMLWAQSEVL